MIKKQKTENTWIMYRREISLWRLILALIAFIVFIAAEVVSELMPEFRLYCFIIVMSAILYLGVFIYSTEKGYQRYLSNGKEKQPLN